jgi:hypothetical protein
MPGHAASNFWDPYILKFWIGFVATMQDGVWVAIAMGSSTQISLFVAPNQLLSDGLEKCRERSRNSVEQPNDSVFALTLYSIP